MKNPIENKHLLPNEREIQRSEAVDELLILPQAYVVSSRVGGWVSPSPEQAAKHIFNTHMHDEHIGNSASHVKLSNQE